MFVTIYQIKSSGPQHFSWGVFDHIFNLITSNRSEDFLFFHDSILVGYTFLRIYPLLLDDLICWHIIVH